MPNLREYADAYIVASGYDTDLTEKTLRQYNSVLNLSYTVVISDAEPVAVLPLNCIWLDMNRLSNNYKMFVVRISKTDKDGYKNTWERLTDVAQLWLPQYYDQQDNSLYAGKILDATTDTAGVAKLSYVSETPLSPVFVSTTDSRLADKRRPKAHNHVEKAMRLIKDATGAVAIDAGILDEGVTIVAESSTQATQRHLLNSEVK